MDNWLIRISQKTGTLSKKEVETILARIYAVHKSWLQEEGINSWLEWIKDSPNSVAGHVVNDSNIYNQFLIALPEGITFYDVLGDYLANNLIEAPQQTRLENLPIEPTGDTSRINPWHPWQHIPLVSTDPKELYTKARERAIGKNKEEVLAARRELFFLFNTDGSLSDKIGVKKSELNRYIKQISGLSVQNKRIQEHLNADVPEEHQWVGIYNSTFAGQTVIKPEDVDKFVKEVIITNEGKEFYESSRGQAFRQYISHTFLAIDTHLTYKELSFLIGKCTATTVSGRPARGQYDANTKKIIVADVNRHTVAHEIGHYLDHLFGGQLTLDPAGRLGITEITNYDPRLPKEQIEWAKKFRKFLLIIKDRADIGAYNGKDNTEYLQRMTEIFARFVARFVAWTQSHAGVYNLNSVYDAQHYDDNFNEGDYRAFVRLLQEKSYVDAKYPINLGV
jgi:hypothetical protein